MIYTCYVPCTLISLLGWWAMSWSDAFYRAYKLDATLLRYVYSLSVWASLAVMTYSLVLQVLVHTHVLGANASGLVGTTEVCVRWSRARWYGGGQRTCLERRVEFSKVMEQAFTALLVTLGVGVQPILLNFASGLLLVLFRPFRVGDDVMVGGQVTDKSPHAISLCTSMKSPGRPFPILCSRLQAFTVRAITAFFVRGTSFTNVHVSLVSTQ